MTDINTQGKPPFDDLVEVEQGKFLSKKDPLFWSKLLQIQPENPEALFHVSLIREQEAQRFLEEYKKTKDIHYKELYRKRKNESIELMSHSFRLGYEPAKKEIKRMGYHIPTKTRVLITKKKGIGLSKTEATLLAILSFLFGIVLAALLFAFQDPKTERVENYYAYLIPYEVLTEKPKLETKENVDQQVIEVSSYSDKAKIANQILGVIRQMHVKNPHSEKRVYAVTKTEYGKKEVGVGVYNKKDSSIKVYIYDNSNETALLWETTTVLRNALYQYTLKHQKMPQHLSELTKPFPKNYLTALPFEPFTKANAVSSVFTGKGGWVYQPQIIRTGAENEIRYLVTKAICPNLVQTQYSCSDIPFEPLRIHIYKDSNELLLLSGQQVLRTYPVALGKNNKTPEGNFFIHRKVMNPNKQLPKSPYGTRGLELSDTRYAIHGTNHPKTIGKNVSLGCIRMHNQDINELYAMTSLYTPVLIQSHAPAKQMPNDSDGSNPSKNTPSSDAAANHSDAAGSTNTTPSDGKNKQPTGVGSGSNGNAVSGSGGGAGSGNGNGNKPESLYPTKSNPNEENPKEIFRWSK